MDRRTFLKTSAGSAALAATDIERALFAQTPQDRPNIFMIFSDDCPQRDYGCYGNPVVQTPNIDQLAREGMKFDNAFTASPTCVPSRTCMYTGLYPIRNGAHPNWSSMIPGTKTLPHYLKALGYRVILLGKKHLTPWSDFPFEHHGNDPFEINPGKDLERILAEPQTQPWCIILCKFSAHVAWPHNNYNYKPEEVDIPPDHVDTPETRELRTRYYSKISEMDEGVGMVLKILKETKRDQNTLTIYTADHGTDWPKQKWNLYDGGINVPFIARWPGKIKPGSVTDAMISYVDIVPTFIEIAGGDVSKTVAEAGGEPLDGKSFLPVLMGRTNDHHEAVFGCFTWGVMTAYPMRAVRTKTHKYIWNIDSHFRYTWPPDTGWWGETHAPMALTQWAKHGWSMAQSWMEKGKTDPGTAAKVDSFQYRPPYELYDIQNDPYELNNLANDSSQAAVLATMREHLDQWMKLQGDKGDSAYHKEANREERFLDKFYSRQTIVNVRMYPWSSNPALEDMSALIEMTCPIWHAEIRYTLDGSEPTQGSSLYTEPFTVIPTKTLKARGFFKGGETPLRVVEVPEIDFAYHHIYHFKPESWGTNIK